MRILLLTLAFVGGWLLVGCALAAGPIAAQHIQQRIRTWLRRRRLFHAGRIPARTPGPAVIHIGSWSEDAEPELHDLGGGLYLVLGLNGAGHVLEARYVDARHKEAA